MEVLFIIWVPPIVLAIVITWAIIETRFKKRVNELTDLIWEQSGRIDVLTCKVERIEDKTN